MHLDFFAEGVKHDLDEFEKWLETRAFSLPHTNTDGTKGATNIAGALRPRRFYTFVFPREHLDLVLNSLQPENCEVSRVDNKGTKILKAPLTLLRKLFRLKKIPIPDEKKGIFPIYKNNVRLVGLGIRDDVDMTFPNGKTHEAL